MFHSALRSEARHRLGHSKLWGLSAFLALIASASAAGAQALAPPPSEPAASVEASPSPTDEATAPRRPAHFFDHINVRGYTQLRYNQLAASNDRLVNLQGDRSVGQDASILIRRARLVLSGELHPRVQIYLQPDFAGSVGDSIHVPQLRDWYFDLALDTDKAFRLRAGQSKVPFGFENMQSSQNRLPFDRSDALNSALNGERDLGMFFYFAPPEIRRRFKTLVDAGLKGSGDYGMAALGVYEGQTINQPDQNRNKHVVARLSYPFLFGEQFVEAGLQGYTGKFVVRSDDGVIAPDEVRDARAALSLVVYPQPIGLQAEYNIGVGPELTNAAMTTNAEGDAVFTGEVRRRRLHGGYVLVSAKLDDALPGTLIPYARIMNYEGGKKHERNAPPYSVRELEAGFEYQPIRPLEVTAAFTLARRSDGRAPYAIESGRLVRLQLQVNY